MTFDPTTNRIPLELLNYEEKQALKGWPHGWEYYEYYREAWYDEEDPIWDNWTVYRGKPGPRVRSVWHNVFPDRLSVNVFESREMADKFGAGRIAVNRIDIINGKATLREEPL